MTAYFLVHAITGTGHAYWLLLAHLTEVFGHRPHGWRTWWVMTEWHQHPRNLVRVLIRIRDYH